jgi:dTDP-4-dehydrorhamnose reductase
VLRTNIFGWTGGGRPSFAEWVLRGLTEHSALRMFTDVYFTPIHVTHLSSVISQCVSQGLSGLYHASGSTVLSKREFAARMARVFGVSDEGVVPCSVDDAGLGAARPKNMGLSNMRLGAALSRPLEGVDEGLRVMRRQYEDGWAAELKGRTLGKECRFWEAP